MSTTTETPAPAALRKFTIDRATWHSGGYTHPEQIENQIGKGDRPALENTEGYRCCLGQIALQLGCTTTDIKGVGGPTGCPNLRNSFMIRANTADDRDNIDFVDTDLTIKAMSINDDAEMTTPDREAALIELFAKHGYELEFTGEAVPRPAPTT